MSALLKPLTHSTATIVDPSPAVNIEQVLYIDKVTVPQVQNNSSGPIYRIQFRVSEGSRAGDPGVINWDFVDAATRDTEYASILTTFSTVVP